MRVCHESHLHPSLNFIGCSIDGLFTCKCHDSIIIEVKCPFALRDEDPKDVCLKKGCVIDEKGRIVVTEISEYYHQMQGQMGIYNIHQSNLIIYTKKGICVAHANFDPHFFQSMISKLESFFKQHVEKSTVTVDVLKLLLRMLRIVEAFEVYVNVCKAILKKIVCLLQHDLPTQNTTTHFFKGLL
jgi:hypothetical protein